MNHTLPQLTNFPVESLSDSMAEKLEKAAAECRRNILTMVTVAGSGHPAGSFSSLEMYLAVYGVADLTPENCSEIDRDYVAISHGHTSPGAYASLAAWGFFDPLDVVAHFRQCGSPFQGHVERAVPGIDWGSGNLGQGLSAGVGFALAQKARKKGKRTYVLMGDGGQTKGQSAEARRIAAKEKLSNLTVLVDWNNIQISGTLDAVMPADIPALWKADGWKVLECDGHSFQDIYSTLRAAVMDDVPTVILCRTVMGKGVSFMENTSEYHGKAPGKELYIQAMKELGGDPTMLEKALELRKSPPPLGREIRPSSGNLSTGTPRTYSNSDKKTDNRSAFGTALADVGGENCTRPEGTPLLVFDCDLASSVKTGDFAKKCPDWFFQTGIQEHATATVAGAASTAGVVSLWAGFGVFGLSEVYNQQRLNDINSANLKTVLTHVGLDVGEDGMTHQAIDYVGLLRNTFVWRLVVPADPNETDRATRWALAESGCVCIAMGRSKLDVLEDGEGNPLFGGEKPFQYGKSTLVREGENGTIFALGAMTARALEAREILQKKGITPAVYSVSSP
ncbi:MAG: transketolase, partial [Synergistaceae bacterium]|nr:transketolase [Synergistaceae bacterium]